ncbi:unnamed protein product [Lota lota]
MDRRASATHKPYAIIASLETPADSFGRTEDPCSGQRGTRRAVWSDRGPGGRTEGQTVGQKTGRSDRRPCGWTEGRAVRQKAAWSDRRMGGRTEGSTVGQKAGRSDRRPLEKSSFLGVIVVL